MKLTNYKLWDTKRHTPQTFANLTSQKRLEFLCLLGHLGPSSHNTQPWRFKIHPEKLLIDVYIDRTSILAESDIVGRQAVISTGCAIENIILGAKYLGYKPKVTIPQFSKKQFYPQPVGSRGNNLILVSQLSFQDSKSDSSLLSLYKSIFTRKVLRAEYDPEIKIPNALIDKLQNLVKGSEVKLHIINDPLRRFSIAEFQGQADGYVINSKKFSKELGDWLLPNNTNSFLGMPGIGFGLQDDQATRLHKGLSGKTALQPEDGLRFAMAGKIYIEKSPLLAFLTIAQDNPQNWLEAGQVFERIFLNLESQGISVAVHAGIVEVGLIKRLFSASLATTRPLAVFFRAGFTKDKKNLLRPHSPRLPLNDVLLN